MVNSDRSLLPHVHQIAQRMFLDTADLNYIGARSAYFEERDWDFWWLTLHSIEKYLKMLLLMNGRTAKNGSHDIKKLLEMVRGVDLRLEPPPLTCPSIIDLEEHWHTYPDCKFIKRLNEYGSASNRYGTYGYTLFTDDLMKADQLIYWARRHARLLRSEIGDGNVVHSIDWIDLLARNQKDWHLHAGPLEKIAALPETNPRRWSLVNLNAAFFPDVTHRLDRWRSSASNAPIVEWIEDLTISEPDSDERSTSRAVILWVIKNIQLSKSDEEELRNLLKTHE